MTHEEFEELVSVYVVSQVTPEEEKGIREHMEVCASCRKLYEQEKIIKETLHRLKGEIPIPPGLDKKLIRSLEKVKNKRSFFTLYTGVTTSVVVLFILASFIGVYIFKTEPNSMCNEVSENHKDIIEGKLPIAYETENPDDLKIYFDKTGDIPFNLMVDDFSAMGFKLKGGLVKEIGKRKCAILIYEGKEFLCEFIMISSESDFPRGAKKTRDEKKGIDFYSLRRGSYNLVMWKEKNTTCILVSKLDEKQLLSLAIATAKTS